MVPDLMSFLPEYDLVGASDGDPSRTVLVVHGILGSRRNWRSSSCLSSPHPTHHRHTDLSGQRRPRRQPARTARAASAGRPPTRPRSPLALAREESSCSCRGVTHHASALERRPEQRERPPLIFVLAEHELLPAPTNGKANPERPPSVTRVSVTRASTQVCGTHTRLYSNL